MKLNDLSDDDLLTRLQTLCLDARRLDVQVILLLIAVDERRLHLTSACSSLFDFCVRRLGMSEGAAFRRITAARLVRRFPRLLGQIESGAMHLSTLVLLRDHLTETNVEDLVTAVSGKTKREVQELLARVAPRPDVPSTLRKLPSTVPIPALAPSPPAAPLPPAPARLEPLSPARYKLQVTASAELRDKLERARDLMRHRNPAGDLAVVVERAVDALLEKLEKERLGATTRPRPRRTASPARQGRVSRAARREIFERDGEQCTFVDEQHRRCPARAFLEVDHVQSRALGGSGDAANLRVRCRAHNRLHAEEVFGEPHVARQINVRQRKYERVEVAAEPPIDAFDAARRGLVNLGFRDAEARRALETLRRQESREMPLGELLREALAVLASDLGRPAASRR
jgi:hypothetical protein